MAAIPHAVELLSSVNVLHALLAFSQMKEKQKIPKRTRNTRWVQLQGAVFFTGVRFVPAAPQLAPLVVATAKSIFNDRGHI